MNSISYLDSVLTRSLTSTSTRRGSSGPGTGSSPASASASGTSTPSSSHSASDATIGGALQRQHRLDRRASDYALSSRRQRERQRLANSLGFSSIDATGGQQKQSVGQEQESPPKRKKRSSKRSSRAGSTKGSEVDGPTASSSAGGSEGISIENAEEGRRRKSDRHPKSSSESLVASTTEERRKLKRTKSTPGPLWDTQQRSLSSSGGPPGSSRWGSLWGLGGWLDGSESYDSYARRSSYSATGGSRAGRRVGSLGDTDVRGTRTRRRASSGEVDLDGIAPQMLLSEREREDVVDFEGFDPDDDGQSPIAPPSTPHPSSLEQSPLAKPLTPSPTTFSAGGRPAGSNSSLGTGSRLSSLLFGALNPLTDDYFGPQPSHIALSHSRRSSAEEREQRRQRKSSSNKVSTKTQESKQQQQSEKQENGHEGESTKVQKDSEDNQQQSSAKADAGAGEIGGDNVGAKEKEPVTSTTEDAVAPSDPPPPYSDVATFVSSSSMSPSSSSASLQSSESQLQSDSDETTSPKSTSGRVTSGMSRGLRRVLEILRRVVLAILLAPARLIYLGRSSKRRKLLQQQSSAVAVAELPHRQDTHDISALDSSSRPTLSRTGSLVKFQTQSQAQRPSAARHVAGRRSHRPPTPNVDAKDSFEEEQRAEAAAAEALLSSTVDTSADEDKQGQNESEISETDEDQVVTEEQAEARALRKAQRARRLGQLVTEREARLAKEGPVTPVNSRLLPNPNPVDPLLAHDRRVKPVSGTRKEAELRAAQLSQAATIVTSTGGATGGAVAGLTVAQRGPSSSLIHHSPKVLVLDLDETLIHSTSRNPTWSALAEKGRNASISTGGSLLGMEGLGGVLGLRGQVGVRPHQVEVVLDGRSIVYHVYKRPHVDYFLRKVASWYHVVVFTASVQEYADPVIDWLDQGRGLIGTRLFRDSCTYRNGSYQKNLAHVDADLSRVCLVDNSPASYQINQANGIPIEGWTHDPNDEGLLDLLPVLDSLRFASDVRHILGVRGF